MEENQHDHEAIDLREDIPTEIIFSEESYFIEAINSVSEEIVTDEFLERNRLLIENITSNFCNQHFRHGNMPPELGGKNLEIFFSSLAKIGLR